MLISKDIEPVTNKRRSRINLTIGFAIGVALAIINIGVNFPGAMGQFFEAQAEVSVVRVGLNMLFVWLLGLLMIAFLRWREAERGQSNLENVLSGISPDALVVVNPDRKVVMCNPSVFRLFGRRETEVIGQSTDLLYGDRRQRVDDPREIYNDLTNDGYHIGVATGKRADGSTFPLEIISGDLPERRGAVLMLRDITDRVQEEESRRRMELQLREREHLESLGMLAGGVAHDFNNLLAGILGNAEIALDHLDSKAGVQGSLKEIVKAVDRSATICKDLLAYAGKGRIQPKRVNLTDLLHSKESDLFRIGENRARVSCDIGADPMWMEADARQIQQLLDNLVTNAVEALEETEDGRLVVSLVMVDYSDELFKNMSGKGIPGRNYALIQVADNGCGMSSETMKNVFKPFFTTKFPGRGLGLASVQGIVRAHHGLIRLDSNEGRGTTVTVLLPLEAEASEGEDNASPPGAAEAVTV